MKRNRLLLPVAVYCLALMAASCSDLTGDDGTTLPDGTYPMTFTAAVDGLVATRATTDNTWTEGDKVAIQIGNEVKEYAAASNGNLTVASDSIPFYRQSTAAITVNAWYPYSASKPAAADLRVKANQGEGNNYQSSDYLEAANAAVAFNNPELAFKHRTAKVVVTLVAGEGVTGVADATVTFINQTGVDGGTEVTSKKETSGGGAITYTALLIPQQMQNQKFIKVTLRGNDYFYTPTGQNDANLMGGNRYIYTVTVTKNGLAVTAGGATEWNSGPTTDVTSKEPASGYSASDLKIGDYYYSDGTWSDGGYRKYSDNTTAILPVMPVLTDADGDSRTVIGIVLKAGKDGEGSWKDDCDYKLKGTATSMTDIHGYVLGLYDAKGKNGYTVAPLWGLTAQK